MWVCVRVLVARLNVRTQDILGFNQFLLVLKEALVKICFSKKEFNLISFTSQLIYAVQWYDGLISHVVGLGVIIPQVMIFWQYEHVLT